MENNEKTKDTEHLKLPKQEEMLVDDQQKVKKKKRLKMIALVVGIILAVVIFFVLNIFLRLRSTFQEIYVPLSPDVVDVREGEELPPLELGEDPFSVLILGLDEGRSDAIMVATVNPNEGTTYLLSIARDTMVEIPGFGTTRLNHAHAYGGVDLAVNMVQEFLNIPIDYFVTLMDNQFYALVDAFGGVRVYNSFAFSFGDYHFPLGYVDLDGSSAYHFVGMRFEDPRGDFGRQERQRDILQAMLNEIAGITVVTRYQQILDAVGDAMQTNVTLGEMMIISLNYNTALRNIIPLQLHYPGRITNGMYLIPIPEESRIAMSQRLRQHLELE